jgi:hypothetical protein
MGDEDTAKNEADSRNAGVYDDVMRKAMRK